MTRDAFFSVDILTTHPEASLFELSSMCFTLSHPTELAISVVYFVKGIYSCRAFCLPGKAWREVAGPNLFASTV